VDRSNKRAEGWLLEVTQKFITNDKHS